MCKISNIRSDYAATIRFSNDKANCGTFQQSTAQGESYCASGSIKPVMSVWMDNRGDGDMAPFVNLCEDSRQTALRSSTSRTLKALPCKGFRALWLTTPDQPDRWIVGVPSHRR